jgi:hypothetical protein
MFIALKLVVIGRALLLFPALQQLVQQLAEMLKHL